MSGASLVSIVCGLVLVLQCHAQSEVDVGVTGQTMGVTEPLVTTEGPILVFSIEMYHRESTTSSISIIWRPRIPEGIEIEKYQIRTQKLDSDSIITTPDLPPTTTEYIVEDLIKESKWQVCVVATIKNDTQIDEEQECIESFTIPYIRPDSVYVLAIVILVIMSLIIAGYVSWRCAVSAAEQRAEEAAAAEDDGEEDESDEEKKEL